MGIQAAARDENETTAELDFFTNIHLCSILLSKMTPAEKYCHFWPGGSAKRRHVAISATGIGGKKNPPSGLAEC
jgi:hypothetical protein